MAVKVQFEIGHTSKLKIKKTREGFTHDWELYVKGVNGADIGCFVEKVVFNLHDSFPKPKRVCKEPPYLIQESGYAGFMLPIDIYLRNREEPKMLQFNYDLSLHTVGPPQHRSDIQKYIFENPSEEFRQKLMKGGGIPVAAVTSGAAITTPLPVALNQENHKSISMESKKHKSRSEESKVASFADLFGPPITKNVCPSKHSPEYKSSGNNSNQVTSKLNNHSAPNSTSSSNLNKEKLNKDKNLSSSSSKEKSKELQERKEKHAKSSSSDSPQKDGSRSNESKRKHDRRDKSDDKFKKEKTRDKDKERNRNDKTSSSSFLHQGTSTTNTTNNMTTSSITTSSKRPFNNSPKREIAISPHRNSPATLTNTSNCNNPIARPSSSNGARIELDGKNITKDQTKSAKDSISSSETKSKVRDINSTPSTSTSTSSTSRKSKKERKEKDKDRDRERDKEKQKSTDANQTSKIHNQHSQSTNDTTNGSNIFNSENKWSTKPIGLSGANTSVIGNFETTSIKREKSSNHKTTTNETKSMEKVTSNVTNHTLSSTSVTATSNLSHVEKSKFSSSNNSTSPASATTGGGGTPNTTSGNSSCGGGTLPGDKDKQRSHKHKKREKNKDRDRDKERERDKDKERDRDKDKDKDLKKDEKKEKDKHDKMPPVESKNTLNHPPLRKTITNSPSLSSLLEENNATLTTNASSNHKNSQSREKKSRDKFVNKEEKSKRKQNESNEAGGSTKGSKLIKLSNHSSINTNDQVGDTSLSPLPTSEHSQPTTTCTVAAAPASTSLAQRNVDLSDNDSLHSTTITATTTYLTPNEQLRNKNNCNSNDSDNIKNKTPSHLIHSDSSNSGCSTDMLLKLQQQQQQQTVAVTTAFNNNNSRSIDTTKICNATTASTNNVNVSRDSSKTTSNKSLKEKQFQTMEKNESTKINKTDDKKRRRTPTVTTNINNNFVEPPLKQLKKDKDHGKGREMSNKSPSNVFRQGTPTRGNCANSEINNTFLQPSVSPSSNAAIGSTVGIGVAITTTLTTTSTTPLPIASTSANKMTARSPASALHTAEGSIVAQIQQQQSQSTINNALAPPPPQLPPQTQSQTSLTNTLSTDYWSELQELQQKIMTLQDSEDLQHVVELIAATGCYEITTKTFDFDLCKLDRTTVQRLQDFFAASVA